eukprot:scaffold195541_cov52-Prasinocladus_malaysianus.AAC.3
MIVSCSIVVKHVAILLSSVLTVAHAGRLVRVAGESALSTQRLHSSFHKVPGAYICFAAGQLCPPSRSAGQLVLSQCGTSGRIHWRVQRLGLRQEPQFFFDHIESVLTSGGILVELGGAWNTLSLPIFTDPHQDGQVFTMQPDPY